MSIHAWGVCKGVWFVSAVALNVSGNHPWWCVIYCVQDLQNPYLGHELCTLKKKKMFFTWRLHRFDISVLSVVVWCAFAICHLWDDCLWIFTWSFPSQEELCSDSVERIVVNPNAAYDKFKDKHVNTKGLGECVHLNMDIFLGSIWLLLQQKILQ